jgi:N-formylglutamate amidohydrolase
MTVEAKRAIRHIPHDRTEIPTTFRDQFVLTDAELRHELLRMTDLHTEALFGAGPDSDLIFPVSRLLVDVERFQDDTMEPMATRGMGVLYSLTHDLKPLRRHLSQGEREELLAKYYRPHHALFQRLVSEALDTGGRALVIDCHSFPSRRLTYEIGEEGPRPDICIGTDPFHTPPQLREAVIEGFRQVGFSVAIDRPFSGAITPLDYYGKDKRVMALMIEVRRDLYMDEETGETNGRFDDVRAKVQMMIEKMEAVRAC